VSPARSIAATALAAGALLLAACGGDDEPSVQGGSEPAPAPAETQTATAPATPPEEVVTVPETAPPATVTAPAPAPDAPEEEQGGAGDEEGIRSSARFVVQGDGTLAPDEARVPAFFNAEVTFDNQDDAAHQVEIGDRSGPLPAGRITTITMPGRAATELPIILDGKQAGTLRIAAEGG
jgi:hypothetical protein